MLSFDQYKAEVLKLAQAEYDQPICLDSVKDSYAARMPIDIAVDLVILDSQYWGDGWLLR